MKSEHERLAAVIIEEGIFDAKFYQEQVPDVAGLSVKELACHYLEVGESEGLAPSAIFDPAYYLEKNPDLTDVPSPAVHYAMHGREEGRPSSLAQLLFAEELDSAAVEEGLIPAPEVERSDPDYFRQLAKSVRVIDRDLRFFSREFYRSSHPDIGQSMDPIVHYLRHGRHEGRSTNVTLSAGIHTDEAAIDPDLPYVVVGVHESSKTGAPIVGLDLARELAQTYNVIFVTLRDGPLVEIARGLFPVVMVASQNKADNTMFLDYIAERYDVKDAFFSSGCCGAFLYPMSAGKYRITCLIHEFLEYMLPDHHAVLACDLLVFSSKELLKSWQYMLDSYNRDPDTVMVLPQPASATNSRRMSKAEARKAVADAAGLDIDDDTTLVLGAGQVQIRKGTDIFLQIGSQLKREAGKFVSVWIGEQISELELSFGVYFHVQIDRCRDENGVCPVHFEPAGPLYPILMDAADVFLVTSRLDPLPNVALDAAARDMPVIAFAGATGLADIAEQGEMNLIEVEMGAVDEVIAAIKANTAQPAAGKRFAVSGASMSSGEGADRQGSRQRHHVDTGVA